MWSRLAVSLLALVASLCLAASPPKGRKTEYLLTTGAGFTMTETEGAVYAMTYEIRKPLPAKVYGVALFENPETPGGLLRREFEVEADARKIQIQSPKINVIRNNSRYKVKLTLYLDPEHKSVLTRHDQEVLFNMKKEMHVFLQQRYGLVVR